ncbi:response regulator [Vallitalea sp.]|uniref:response regulator n=1 Tax=Vallitalea sp. TaxID=1882829 RepID=UPI0025E50D46|nr:response regulator [Vallitalea sp.]MCT4687936.1 response regulator [Vallitalea sp.]
MLNAILVDDERPALRALQILLNDYNIEVEGMFTNPAEALEIILEIKPNVVFVDVSMPQFTGIDLASRIIDGSPNTDIVFVTAYEEYAVDAFELYALDYLMKPLNKRRLEKTINRIITKNKVYSISKDEEQPLIINCLGEFEVKFYNKPPIKWRTKKIKELFAFLICHHGQVITKDMIIETIWPQWDIKKAIHQLHNGIYYIRKTLTDYGVKNQVELKGKYCLECNKAELDIDLFKKQYIEINKMTNINEIQKVKVLYKGEYFQGEDWIWSTLDKERLSEMNNNIFINLAEKYIEIEKYSIAEEYLKKAFYYNVYDEKTTKILLSLYKKNNEKVKATKHFIEYRQLLYEELGILPHKDIVNLFNTIK